MASVLTLLLSHQSARDLETVLRFWKQFVPPADLLLAYGGHASEFAKLEAPEKIFIADPRLRKTDLQRERQSYTGVLREALIWLRGRPHYEFVHFVEFDHVPLVPDFQNRMIARLDEEKADILAHHLQRIDATNHPHYLYHCADPAFHDFFSTVSVRTEQAVVLSMLATGSFWRRAAFDDVAARDEPFPIYVEVYLPTVAHHLGYRLRDFGEQNECVANLAEFAHRLDECRARGAWTAHPVKQLAFAGDAAAG